MLDGYVYGGLFLEYEKMNNNKDLLMGYTPNAQE